MSVPQIASAFHVIRSNVPDDEDDVWATITCDLTNYVTCDDPNLCGQEDESRCYNPTFVIKRQVINIPELGNVTADKLSDRIILKPGGDCKLVVDGGSVHDETFNVSFTGASAAIVCGLSSALDANGTAVPIYDPNDPHPRPSALSSSRNAFTDGAVHNVAAPPVTGFVNALDASNSACFGGTEGGACLVNETYESQSPSSKFDSGKANSLVMPPGALVSFNKRNKDRDVNYGPSYSFTFMTFSQNVTSDNKDFADGMSSISEASGSERIFNVIIPQQRTPRVLCLFTEKNYLGDVVCYGSGSGNLSTSDPFDMTDKAQSIIPFGGVTALAYARFYGDDGFKRVREAISHLEKESNGADQTFNKAIEALCVL